jgi:hypothetical protein
MSFGKRQAEQPRWLDEDEIDAALEASGMAKPAKSGISLVEIVGGGILISGAFSAVYFSSELLALVNL